MTSEKMLKWMAGQSEEIHEKIIEMMLQEMAKDELIRADKIDTKTVKASLKKLIISMSWYYMISKRINPGTGKKFDLINDTEKWLELKKMYINNLKSMSKKKAKKTDTVTRNGAKIIELMSAGVSYKGLQKMIRDDLKIKVSKALLSKIINENNWKKIADERRKSTE